MSDQQASRRGFGISDVTMLIQRLRPLFSGQGVQVEELCRELARRSVRTTLLTAGHGRNSRWESLDGYRVRRLRADIPWISRWLRPGRFRSEIFAFKTLVWLLLHGWRTQLLHVHAQSDALYSCWLFARLRRIPLVFEMTLMGADDAAGFAANTNRLGGLRNAVFRRCDGYVAISPALARAYEGAGLPADKLRLIPQGVDTQRFRPPPDAASMRRRLGVPGDGPLVVFVGSLIERKGIDLLLHAWEQIHAARADATLVMVGVNLFPDDPAAESFLAQHLDRLSPGARTRTMQVGVQGAVEEYLAAADVFAFASRREGFGTAMIEAMSAGLPCVVAELVNITDYIFAADDSTGVVVPADDAGALAAGVAGFLAEPERARSVGEAARQHATEHFSIVAVADAYLDLYADLTAQGSR